MDVIEGQLKKKKKICSFLDYEALAMFINFITMNRFQDEGQTSICFSS